MQRFLAGLIQATTMTMLIFLTGELKNKNKTRSNGKDEEIRLVRLIERRKKEERENKDEEHAKEVKDDKMRRV